MILVLVWIEFLLVYFVLGSIGLGLNWSFVFGGFGNWLLA